LILSPKSFTGPLPKITIDRTPLKISTTATCLGVKIDDKLSWKEHTLKVTKSFAAKIRKLYQMQAMSPETLKSIYLRGILPSATYALSIWGNCSDAQLSRLNEYHCKVARMILRAKTDAFDYEILERIGWDSFETMYKKQLACLTFKLFKNQLPNCLHKWKAEMKNGRVLRNHHRVKMPSFKKLSYKKFGTNYQMNQSIKTPYTPSSVN